MHHLQGLQTDLLSINNQPYPPLNPLGHLHRYTATRKCHSEETASSHTSGISTPQHNLEVDTANVSEALRQQLNRSSESTANDVPATSTSACIREPHDACLVTNTPCETNFVKPIPSQEKSPAQREWERLWYNGVASAFSSIAHHFPQEKDSVPDTAGFSIAEPALPISSLKQEDRALFEKEEQTCTQASFAPASEQERLCRLESAERAIDEIQRLALLLGLPTFDQYIEKKRQAEVKSQIDSSKPSQRQLKREAKFIKKKQNKLDAKAECRPTDQHHNPSFLLATERRPSACVHPIPSTFPRGVMTHERKSSKESTPLVPATHRPLVVGLTKPQSRSASTMASSSDAAALNKEIEQNVKENTKEAAPTEDNPTAPQSQKPKKEKAPKQPKPQKAAAPAAPTTPALIDLRVGHILRAIAHPNADSLYVSTIAMGDAEGTEHTQVDEETGNVVRTVCSGLNGLVPLEEMQNRKIVVVANLKPVNMRSIKSAAMVLAASPKQPEGADPHAPDRVVELVMPPEGSEAGDKVYFEGWPYGEGKGPEKVLNPKKKQWEAIQPGFYTSDDLVVGFDASVCEEVEGSATGKLVVEGKGPCTVKTLKGAVVR